MDNETVAALSDQVDRHEQQKATGEWEGPGEPNWLTMCYPCGQPVRVGPRKCPCAPGARGRRAVIWSQVMAAPDVPFGRFVR